MQPGWQVGTSPLSYEPANLLTRAVAGDGMGNVDVAGWPGRVWVRVHGEQSQLVQATSGVTPAYDQNVLIQVDIHTAHQYKVVGLGAGTAGGAELLFGTIISFNRQEYTAVVSVDGNTMTGVDVAWSIRPDLMVAGVHCIVAHNIVISLYHGAPALDPHMDPMVGHKHRGLIDDAPVLGRGPGSPG